MGTKNRRTVGERKIFEAALKIRRTRRCSRAVYAIYARIEHAGTHEETWSALKKRKKGEGGGGGGERERERESEKVRGRRGM